MTAGVWGRAGAVHGKYRGSRYRPTAPNEQERRELRRVCVCVACVETPERDLYRFFRVDGPALLTR